MGGAWTVWVKGPYRLGGLVDREKSGHRLNTLGVAAETMGFYLRKLAQTLLRRNIAGSYQGKYLANQADRAKYQWALPREGAPLRGGRSIHISGGRRAFRTLTELHMPEVVDCAWRFPMGRIWKIVLGSCPSGITGSGGGIPRSPHAAHFHDGSRPIRPVRHSVLLTDFGR